MIEKTIDLNGILHPSVDANYFSTALSYASDKIEILEFEPQGKLLKIHFSGSEDELISLIEKVKVKIGKDIFGNRMGKVFTRQSRSGMYTENAWEELVNSGCVFEYGEGHNGYSGIFLELVEALDSFLLAVARKMNARELNLPNFVSHKHLKRLGLIDEFPHYLFFVAPLINDMDNVESFQKEDFSEGFDVRKYLAEPKFYLKTSACSLLYPLLENKILDEYTYFTVLGHCTRYESHMVKSFERLTEFKMREIVFVGDENGVRDYYQFVMSLLKDMIETLDLTGEISVANDSFFISNYNKFKVAQILGYNKYEANVRIPGTNANIAFASFNNHQNFFSKRFNFSCKDKNTVSACVGFGLERLAFGIVSQHGLQREKIMSMVEGLKHKYLN